jgi:hypothetical protein
MVPMKIRHGEFQAPDQGRQACRPQGWVRPRSSTATPDPSRHSGVAATADGIRAGTALSASAESSAPGSRCDGLNPPDLLGRRHDPSAFPRRKVGPPPCGLGPVRVSLSKRGPAASLRLSAGQRSSLMKQRRTRSRVDASALYVTVLHASGCKTQGTLSAAFAATATRAKPLRGSPVSFPATPDVVGVVYPPHFQRKLDVGVARSGHAVAARRRSGRNGAVHPGLSLTRLVQVFTGPY